MKGLFPQTIAAAVFAVVVHAGLAAQSGSGPQGSAPPEPKARPDLVTQPYNEADVNFMQGMIPHHAQAVAMATMAPTHAGSASIKILCERQLVSLARAALACA